MLSLRNFINSEPLDKELDDGLTSPCSSASGHRTKSFSRVPIIILGTVVVFALLIAGTAATSISYPPIPLQWKKSSDDVIEVETALDGNYKLIGPLLLTTGCLLLVALLILCAITTKEAYIASKTIRPSSVDVIANPVPMSLLGGPFYLAAPSANASNQMTMTPFAFSRHLWTIPSAPTPDFSIDAGTMKGSKLRAATATLIRNSQPPYNPDTDERSSES